jgi:hypothetical protein
MIFVSLVVTAAVIWAVANNQMRALGEIHPLAFNGAVALMSLPFFFGLAFWRHPHAMHY